MPIRPQTYAMPHGVARDYGFPNPEPGLAVQDADGHIWHWVPDQVFGLGDFGELGAWTTTVGAATSLGGTALGSLGSLVGLGAIAGPLGAIAGLIGGAISAIFGHHAAAVAAENKISGNWAQNGPAAINQVMQQWESGQISGSDASTALSQIEAQFQQMTTPIVKTGGQAGVFPDPNAPQPSQCNWACGTSIELHNEIAGLQSQIGANPTVGAGGFLADPVVLIGIGLAAFLLLKK